MAQLKIEAGDYHQRIWNQLNVVQHRCGPQRRRMTRSSKLWQKQELAYVVESVSCSRALRAMKSWATTMPQKKSDVRLTTWRQWNLQFERLQSAHAAAVVKAKWWRNQYMWKWESNACEAVFPLTTTCGTVEFTNVRWGANRCQNLQNARTFGKVGCKDISTALTHVMSCSVGCVVSVLISVTVDACHRSA